MSEAIPEEIATPHAEEIELRDAKERKNRPHLGYMCSKDFLWDEAEEKNST